MWYHTHTFQLHAFCSNRHSLPETSSCSNSCNFSSLLPNKSDLSTTDCFFTWGPIRAGVNTPKLSPLNWPCITDVQPAPPRCAFSRWLWGTLFSYISLVSIYQFTINSQVRDLLYTHDLILIPIYSPSACRMTHMFSCSYEALWNLRFTNSYYLITNPCTNKHHFAALPLQHSPNAGFP